MAEQAVYTVLEDRGAVSLRGADGRDFLQNLITNDMDKVDQDHTVYAALLTPQGKFLFDFFVLEHDDGLWLECDRARAGELVKRLSVYRLRKKIEIVDESAQFTVAAIYGDDGFAAPQGSVRALGEGIVWRDTRHPDLGARALLPATSASATLAEAGLAAAGREAWEAHRLALGVPFADADLIPEKAFAIESDFEDLNAVDFDKGCYIGQEVTSRSHYRGNVRKRLLPVRISGGGAAAGAAITSEGRAAGELTSVAGSAGIALLRIDRWQKAAAEGTPLLADGAEVTPWVPDWLNLPEADERS